MLKHPDKRIIVKFYCNLNHKEPVRDWLTSLKQEDRKTIGNDIKTVEMGWPLGMPLVEKFENNLWEVRSNISAGCIARVFFTIVKQDMVLLHGIVKKSMKTPQKDKKLAKSRRDKVRGK